MKTACRVTFALFLSILFFSCLSTKKTEEVDFVSDVDTVEEIQDIVEKVLLSSDYKQTAKNYILYRNERTKVRELNSNLMRVYREITFADLYERWCKVKYKDKPVLGIYTAAYKKLEPFIDKTVKHFDFTKKGDLELKHYGALIYPVSIASYFYASRDKYEVQENARRFSVTVPLMFFGEKLIQNPIHKWADKKFGTNIFNDGKIKSYEEIKQMPEKIRKQAIKAKNIAYGAKFFINTMAIAAGVALLNRYETHKRYTNEHKNDVKPIQNKENKIWNSIKI